jgi:hypothetical protein
MMHKTRSGVLGLQDTNSGSPRMKLLTAIRIDEIPAKIAVRRSQMASKFIDRPG